MRILSLGGLGWVVESTNSCIAINPNFMSVFGSHTKTLFRYTPNLTFIDYDISKIDAVFQLSDQFQHIHPFWLSKFHDVPVFTPVTTVGVDTITETKPIRFNEEIALGNLSITIVGCKKGDGFWDNMGAGCIIREATTDQTVFFQGTAPLSNTKANSMRYFDAIFISWTAYSTLGGASGYVNLYDDKEYASKADDSALLLKICDILPPTRKIFLMGSDIESPDGALFRHTSKEYADFLNPYMILCETSSLEYGQMVDISSGEVSMAQLSEFSADQLKHETKTILFTESEIKSHAQLLQEFIDNYGQIILLTEFGKEMFGTSSIMDYSLGAARFVLRITDTPDNDDLTLEYNMQVNKFVKVEAEDAVDLKIHYPYGVTLDYKSLILSITGQIQFWELANSNNLSQWYLHSPKSSPVTSLFLYFQEMCNKESVIRNFKQRIESGHRIIDAYDANLTQLSLS